MLDQIQKWVAINGKWDVQHTKTFLGSGTNNLNGSYGLLLCSTRLRDGMISVQVKGNFDENQDSAARIVYGYNSSKGSYYSVGLGGYGVAYSLALYESEKGWLPLKTIGLRSFLKKEEDYNLFTSIHGQTVAFKVNDVEIFRSSIPTPIEGDQVGLFAWGNQTIEFSDVQIESQPPKAFIVMQFSEPYESLYEEVIKPVVEMDKRIEAHIASDVSKPGIILEDIVHGIKESAFIIAEITPTNANVFYELGYAHALEKPVILLAERSTRLPFDISGYRCIFYDNTIKDKNEVEQTLKEHINSILN